MGLKLKLIRLEGDTIPKNDKAKEPILYILKTGGEILQCYSCGERAFLDHEVKIDGENVTINPSLICPHCSAHYWVRNSEIVQ